MALRIQSVYDRPLVRNEKIWSAERREADVLSRLDSGDAALWFRLPKTLTNEGSRCKSEACRRLFFGHDVPKRSRYQGELIREPGLRRPHSQMRLCSFTK